jgi:hypothetical protein
MARNSFRRPAPDAFDREYLQTMESLMAADARSNPRQDEILGLSGYRARVLYPKFEDGGGVNSGSLSAADGRARVRGSLFTRDINFLSNRRGGKKRVHANPAVTPGGIIREAKKYGLVAAVSPHDYEGTVDFFVEVDEYGLGNGYHGSIKIDGDTLKFFGWDDVENGTVRVLKPKGVASAAASMASALKAGYHDFRATVNEFAKGVLEVVSVKGMKGGAKSNPHRDELLAIAGYDARVLWPKYSATGGVNSGNASYIPRSVGGSLFDRDINLISNPRPGGSAGGRRVGGPAGRQKFEGTTKTGKRREVSVAQVLAMPGMFDEDTHGMALMLYERGVLENGRGGRGKNRHNPSKDQKAQALAQQVVQHWPKVSPYAEQQLFFMLHPDMITGGDRIEHVIASFLANADFWLGDKAREIKAELNKLL